MLKYIIVIAAKHFSLCVIYFKAIVKCEVHKAIISYVDIVTEDELMCLIFTVIKTTEKQQKLVSWPGICFASLNNLNVKIKLLRYEMMSK